LDRIARQIRLALLFSKINGHIGANSCLDSIFARVAIIGTLIRRLHHHPTPTPLNLVPHGHGGANHDHIVTDIAELFDGYTARGNHPPIFQPEKKMKISMSTRA